MKTSTERSKVAWAIAALLIAAGCESTPTAPPAPPAPQHVEVTLLVYSGRPNPKFDLDDTAIAKLSQLLAATTPDPTFRGTSVTPSILGYQGILVRNGSQVATLPEALAVHGVNVETHNGRGMQFLRDPRQGIETFLIDLAVEQKAITREDLGRLR